MRAVDYLQRAEKGVTGVSLASPNNEPEVSLIASTGEVLAMPR